MFGRLTVREAVNDLSGALILDGNGRVIALCSQHADAIDLASAWNKRFQVSVATEQEQEQRPWGRFGGGGD